MASLLDILRAHDPLLTVQVRFLLATSVSLAGCSNTEADLRCRMQVGTKIVIGAWN